MCVCVTSFFHFHLDGIFDVIPQDCLCCDLLRRKWLIHCDVRPCFETASSMASICDFLQPGSFLHHLRGVIPPTFVQHPPGFVSWYPLIAHSSYFGRLHTRGLPGLTPTLRSTPPPTSCQVLENSLPSTVILSINFLQRTINHFIVFRVRHAHQWNSVTVTCIGLH